jgi:hypothetical protein
MIMLAAADYMGRLRALQQELAAGAYAHQVAPSPMAFGAATVPLTGVLPLCRMGYNNNRAILYGGAGD